VANGFEKPDVLVLGGGGILGEAWMSSLLAGLFEETGFDPRECSGYVGTSAGSIVAAALVAGVDPRSRLEELPEQPQVPEEAVAAEAPRPMARFMSAAGNAIGPLAAVGLPYLEPGGAAVRKTALSRVTPGKRSLAELGATLERWGANWGEGRLRISAVEMDSGRRVMFGEPGAPDASVSDAVEASCAIPGFFRPIEVEGRRYVDGGVWSPTNLDAAPAGRGSSILVLVPTALEGGMGALRAFSLAAVAAETLAVRARGAEVRTIVPDDMSAAVMGSDLMDGSRSEDVLDAAFAQGRALARD
jgi:NTE family protein